MAAVYFRTAFAKAGGRSFFPASLPATMARVAARLRRHRVWGTPSARGANLRKPGLAPARGKS